MFFPPNFYQKVWLSPNLSLESAAALLKAG
jgi:hypothetical protein